MMNRPVDNDGQIWQSSLEMEDISLDLFRWDIYITKTQLKHRFSCEPEACASTIRRDHAVHPIAAVQNEWSLWSRDLEQEIVPTCRELGIGIVPYNPLGRGFFSTCPKLMENLSEGDMRKVQLH